MAIVIALSFIQIPHVIAQDSFQPTRVEFEQELGEDVKGEGFYNFLTIDGNTSKVEYFFEKKVLPNPYKISYTYNVYKNEDGSLEVDLSSAVEPYDMRIDESVEVEFKGDKLHFPASFTEGQSLKDAKGTFHMYSKKGKLFLVYDVVISNRKVEKKEMISVGTMSVEAFVVTYDYSLTKSNQFEVKLHSSKQTVKEWVIPGVGVIMQDREGESIQENIHDDAAAGAVKFIKKTSSIKDIDRN